MFQPSLLLSELIYEWSILENKMELDVMWLHYFESKYHDGIIYKVMEDRMLDLNKIYDKIFKIMHKMIMSNNDWDNFNHSNYDNIAGVNLDWFPKALLSNYLVLSKRYLNPNRIHFFFLSFGPFSFLCKGEIYLITNHNC